MVDCHSRRRQASGPQITLLLVFSFLLLVLAFLGIAEFRSIIAEKPHLAKNATRGIKPETLWSSGRGAGFILQNERVIRIFSSNSKETEAIVRRTNYLRDRKFCPYLEGCFFFAPDLEIPGNSEWERENGNEVHSRPAHSLVDLYLPSYVPGLDQRPLAAFDYKENGSKRPLRGLLIPDPGSQRALAPAAAKSVREVDFTISYLPGATININKVFKIPKKAAPVRAPVQAKRTRHSRGRALVATILDECETESNREAYIQELSDHIEVAVYGRCGVPCPSTSREDCLSHLAHKRFKFFLVFEDYLCQHYQSEILWQVLETTQLVPVVFGGVDHFGRILPEHSFIDALSQKNPASLARYLGHLGNHEDDYNKYLKWREDFTLVHVEWQCTLCRQLLSGDLEREIATGKMAAAPKRESGRPTNSDGADLLARHVMAGNRSRCTSWPELDFKK